MAARSLDVSLIAANSGGHAFAFYFVMMLGQLLWVLVIMPETRASRSKRSSGS